MIPVITIMGIFFIQPGQAQILKVLDSTTKINLSNFNLKATNDKIITSDLGVIKIENAYKQRIIIINYFGYKPLSFTFPTNDTTILLAENIIRLGEVEIRNTAKNITVIGNFEKKTKNVFVNSRTDKDINFTVVNRFHNNHEHIEAILFYIAKDENYAKSKDIGPIEIVFFNENSSKLPDKEPFHKILVNNYSIGWNKILLPDLAQKNEIIYYGVRWVFNPEKYHYKNIRNKKNYSFFGPKLGVVSRENAEFHQTFFFNAEKGWRPSIFTPAMLALEIIK